MSRKSGEIKRGNCLDWTKIRVLIVLIIMITASGVQAAGEDSIPLYLGIRMANMGNDFLITHAKQSLDTIYDQYKDNTISSDLAAFGSSLRQPNGWNLPIEPHMTTLFLGKTLPSGPADRAYFDSFTEDVICGGTYRAIAYIPGKIMAFVAFVDRREFYFNGRFPHTTIGTNALTAKYSNDLLESLYDTHAAYRASYEAAFSTLTPPISYKITVDGVECMAYVLPIPPVSVKGYTHRFYRS